MVTTDDKPTCNKPTSKIQGLDDFRVDKTPIGKQEDPPLAYCDWWMSFSLDKRLLRLRLVDPDKPFEDWKSWWFNEKLTGDAMLIRADHENGRIMLRGALQVNNGEGFIYLPPDADFPPYEVAQTLPYSHYRLCYRRSNKDWRLRDERRNILTFVSDYQGIINLNWWDELSHIHHDGWVEIDTEGVAHLISASAVEPGTR